MKAIEFEGNTFEYDEVALKDYKNVKRISKAERDLGGFFTALEEIFVGKDEDYAELLGNDFDKIGELMQAITAQENEVKNS